MKNFQGLKLVLIILIAAIISCNQNKEETSIIQPYTEVTHPEWVKDANIYEVNVRQYTPEGTFNAFAQHLPRLKEMGVDILWFMPIHPISLLNRKGPLGSYYSVKDYKDINPEFGTMEDFKTLVRKIHELGMYIIIDWVPNHSGWDNDLIEKHPEWYEKDENGQMFSPYDWTDVVQFDYTKTGLREYQIECFNYWLNETDIDGFRCDVAHQVPIDFWNQVRPSITTTKPVFWLAEAENRALHEKAFNMTYAWEFHHLMNEICNGSKNVSSIDEYFQRNNEEYNTNDIRLYFTSNHDENSWNGTVFERMGDAAEVMSVLSFTLPGMPLIYSGQEAGLDKRLLFFEKDQIEWKDHQFGKLYKDLIKLKNGNQALWNPGFGGTMQRLKSSNDEYIFSFIREKEKNKLVVILNLSDESQDITLHDFNDNKSYTDFFTGEVYKMKNQTISLKPWGYLVLKR